MEYGSSRSSSVSGAADRTRVAEGAAAAAANKLANVRNASQQADMNDDFFTRRAQFRVVARPVCRGRQSPLLSPRATLQINNVRQMSRLLVAPTESAPAQHDTRAGAIRADQCTL